MTIFLRYLLFDITYPDSDGLPMAESVEKKSDLSRLKGYLSGYL
jgi:hypothetical protein